MLDEAHAARLESAGAMSPSKILFGKKPQTSLGSLVPQLDDTETCGGLNSFVEQRRHVLREAQSVLEKRYQQKVVAKEKVNARISRPPARVTVKPGDLVLVRETKHVAPDWPRE